MGDDYAKKKAKCVDAIKSIMLLMRKNQIPVSSKYQKSRVHENLPETPETKEAEILRRFRYLEPESRDQMADKLNDLLVYAEVAKVLRSELIAIVVLDKLHKWENFILNPELDMPSIPSPSPEQKRRLAERKKMIAERDQKTANFIRQYVQYGEYRRAAVQSINPFDDYVKTIKLPPQTIGPPQSQVQEATTARVNLEEQRRREIADYERFGAVKKKLHFDPEYERNLKGPKLPDHALQATSRNRGQDDTQFLYKELQKQRSLDNCKRQLKEALSSIRGNANNPLNKDRIPTPSPERRKRILERRQSIDDRDRRVESTIKLYEGQGEYRRAAVESMNPFDTHVRTITLPPQTIGLPQSQLRGTTSARVNIEEQRRIDIDNYKRFGAIGKRLHDLPAFQHDLKGTKLPDHEIPLVSSSQNVDADSTPSRFKELEKQRELDKMRRQLHEALISHKRKRCNDNERTPSAKRAVPRKESIEAMNRRVTSSIRHHEELRERRQAAVESINPFQDRVRTVTLPTQTIPLPTSSQVPKATATRVNIEEQCRRDIAEYEKFGSIRKKQHELPEYQRDLTGPKLPGHALPSTSKKTAGFQSRYKEIQKQRELDNLRRRLQDALVVRKKFRRDDTKNDSNNSPDNNFDNNPENISNNPSNSPINEHENNPDNNQHSEH